MSNINLLTVSQPQLDLNQPVSVVITAGCQNARSYVVPFSSYSTTGSLGISCPMPAEALVDRTVYFAADMSITFTGTDQGSTLVVAGNGKDALREFSFQQCLNAVTVNFNGLNFSEQSKEEVQPFAKCWSDSDRATFLSTYASDYDRYNVYADSKTQGEVQNTLAAYGNGTGNSRGGFPMEIASASNTSCTYNFRIVEPLCCPPLLPPHQSVDRKAFAHCTNIQVSMQIDDLTKMWSHSSLGNVISSYAVSFRSAPSLIFTLYQQNGLSEKIPKQITYQTYQRQNIPSAETSLANTANTTATLAIQSSSLTSVPSSIVLYARRRAPDRNQNTTDTFARINSVSVDWNERSNLLSDKTPEQLYLMSVKNGLQMSYVQWSKFIGSMVIIRPEDLGMEPDVAGSVLSNVALGIRVNITNQTSDNPIIYQLNCWIVNDALLTVDAGKQWTLRTGYLNRSDILGSALEKQSLPEPSGSGVFDTIYKGVQRVLPFVRPVAQIAKLVNPNLSPYLGAVGLGKKKARGRGIIKQDDVSNLEDFMVERG